MTDDQPLCRRTAERCAGIAAHLAQCDRDCGFGAEASRLEEAAEMMLALPTQPERAGEVTEATAEMIEAGARSLADWVYPTLATDESYDDMCPRDQTILATAAQESYRAMRLLEPIRAPTPAMLAAGEVAFNEEILWPDKLGAAFMAMRRVESEGE